ncbi:PIR Superfamily Protein [Plasmodium ovale wallikeri]|uniref:PIR Superfamily Protein n=1 Tax=Plasmodium ovale wallikeri TaxID=864142 RepID=A0A1A9AKB1_PLAOA|nr:PIR Superfamily Protein [Plasmodium ovale wallikeri]SBT56942.1 PIR Superfamily Protein [Plasmodium ovale wallikeri]
MFVEDNESFKETPLFNFYKELDAVDPCEGDSITYCISGEEFNTENKVIRDLYNKLVTNLKNISNRDRNLFGDIYYDEIHKCTYLKYWLLDRILRDNMNGSQVIQFFKILEQKKRENNFPNSGCEFFSMKMNEIRDIKLLYDYYIFYDKCEGEESDIINEIYKSKYCKYIRNAYFVYDQKKLFCADDTLNGHCREFNKYIENFIDVFEYSSFSCKDEIKIEESGYHPDAKTYQRPETQWFDDLQHDSQSEHSYNALSDNSSTSGSTISTVLSFSFVGIICTLFLLYKFTPFRYLLNTRLGIIKNMLKMKNEKNIQLHSSEYEHDFTNVNNRNYGITYHSM